MGWPDLTEFDFRPRLTSTPLHELRYNRLLTCQMVGTNHIIPYKKIPLRQSHVVYDDNDHAQQPYQNGRERTS